MVSVQQVYWLIQNMKHIGVQFSTTHVGHDFDLAQLTLTSFERKEVGAKIPLSRMLDGFS